MWVLLTVQINKKLKKGAPPNFSWQRTCVSIEWRRLVKMCTNEAALLWSQL